MALVANEETILRQFSEEKQRLMDFQDDLEDIIPTLLSASGIEVANICFRIKNEEDVYKRQAELQKLRMRFDFLDGQDDFLCIGQAFFWHLRGPRCV